MAYRDLNVLDAADKAADLVNKLIDRSPRGRADRISASDYWPTRNLLVAIGKMLAALVRG